MTLKLGPFSVLGRTVSVDGRTTHVCGRFIPIAGRSVPVDVNPKPHCSGPICPHYFERPLTQKVLKCKKSAKNTYSTEKFC
jgi:hypothetical protein